MPWLGDGEEQGFLPNSIAEIINRKEGHERIELEIHQKIKNNNSGTNTNHNSFSGSVRTGHSTSPKGIHNSGNANVAVTYNVKKRTSGYINNEEYRAISTAQCYIANNDYKKALIALKPYIHSKNVAIYLAKCYEKLGDKTKASAYYILANRYAGDIERTHVSKVYDYIKKKNYIPAIQELNMVSALFPNNKEFQNLKMHCQKTIKELLDNSYNEAVSFCDKMKYDDALNSIKNAKEYAESIGEDCEKFDDFEAMLKTAKKKYLQIRDEQDAEKLYNLAKQLYKQSKPDYAQIIMVIKKAEMMKNDSRFSDFLTTVQDEYQEAKAENLYNKGIEQYNNAQFKLSVQSFSNALSINPKREDYREWLEKARESKIDIKICTKQALLTLNCIDKAKADRIIKSRNEGIMWYDYRVFAEQFDIAPQFLSDLEGSIKFPQKQQAKYGRIIDL